MIDYEKKYKTAREKIKGYAKDEYGCTRLRPEDIFPELAESKDEKIRKWLINMIRHSWCEKYLPEGITNPDILSWLENQKSTECVKDEELSELLNKVVCRFINNPDIPYSERDEVSKKIIPYVEMLEKQGKYSMEWDDEDERMINSVIWHLRHSVNNGDTEHTAGQLENWLNSLISQRSIGIIDGQLWRPTDEQMKALDIALRCGINPSTWEGDALRSLISDLKRLIV